MKKFLLILLACAAAFPVLVATGTSRQMMVPFYRHQIKNASLPIEQRLAYADSVARFMPAERLDMMEFKLRTAYDAGHGAAAAVAADLTKTNLDGIPLSRRCRILDLMAASLMRYGKYKLAIATTHRLMGMKKPDSLLYYDMYMLSILDDFNRLRLDKSDRYLKQAETLMAETRGKHLPPVILNRMEEALLDMKMQQAESRGDYQLALRYAALIDTFPLNTLQRTALDINTALIYMKIGRTREAEQYYREILAKNAPSYNTGVALVNLTHLLNEAGRFDESLQAFDAYGHTVSYLNKDILATYAMGNKAVALAGAGRYHEAYGQMLASKLLTDSIYSHTRTEESILNFEIDSLNTEKRQTTDLLRRKNLWLWLLAGGLATVMAVAAAGLMVSRRRIAGEKRRYGELTARCDKLVRELKAAGTKAEEMAGTISSQTIHTEQLTRTLAFIGAFIADTALPPAKKLKEIDKALREADLNRDTWQLLAMSFEQINPSFFKKLSERSADITTNDMRLAAHILMNLTTKEIANITCRSVRSVDSARYRLAKKLSLPEGENLASFLRSL